MVKIGKWAKMSPATEQNKIKPKKRQKGKSSETAKKPKRQRRKDFIYKGDLCFFKKGTDVYLAEEDGSYNQNLSRVIWPGEHVHYVKRIRDAENKTWKHLIEVYSLYYVHYGSMKELTKIHIKYQQTFEEVELENEK